MGYQTVKCKNLLNTSMYLQCRKIERYISGRKCLLCPGKLWYDGERMPIQCK